MLAGDLPNDLPSFLERFGTDAQCHALSGPAALAGRVSLPGVWLRPGLAARPAQLIYQCAACGQTALAAQGHDLRADQDRAFAVVPGDLSGHLEQGRDLGDGAASARWASAAINCWNCSIRSARRWCDPNRPPLSERVEADGTHSSAARGRANRAVVPAARPRSQARSRAVAAKPAAVAWGGSGWPWCPTSRPRSLEGFLAAAVARPATIATDGWSGYGGLDAAGYRPPSRSTSAPAGATRRSACLRSIWCLAWPSARCPAPTTARSPAKHLPAYLDEFVFRFNRRTARNLSHRFARVIEHAVQIQPTPYRILVVET